MSEFVLTASNSLGNSFTQKLECLHDVEVAVRAIEEANSFLSSEQKFYGSVSMKDDKKVTEVVAF